MVEYYEGVIQCLTNGVESPPNAKQIPGEDS